MKLEADFGTLGRILRNGPPMVMVKLKRKTLKKGRSIVIDIASQFEYKR